MTATTSRQLFGRTRLPLIAFGAAASLALLTNPAAAGNDGADQFAFKYSRSELLNSEDASSLYSRLNQSIRRYCEQHGVRGVEEVVRERKCAADTLDKTIEKFNSSLLTAIHKNEHGNVRIASR